MFNRSDRHAFAHSRRLPYSYALHYISANFLAIRNSTAQNSESRKESSIAIIQWPNLPNRGPVSGDWSEVFPPYCTYMHAV